MADNPCTQDDAHSEGRISEALLQMHSVIGAGAIILMQRCFSAYGKGALEAFAIAVAVVYVCHFVEGLSFSKEGARNAFLMTLSSLTMVLIVGLLGFVGANSKYVFG